MTVLARRSSVLLVFVLACVAILLAVNAKQASSASYTTCSLTSKERGGSTPSTLGPTYVLKLRVKGGPSCAGGKNLVKLFYECRTKGSKPVSGRCTTRVSGYSCPETRDRGVGQFEAAVTCSKGSRRVFHRYTQFTD